MVLVMMRFFTSFSGPPYQPVMGLLNFLDLSANVVAVCISASGTATVAYHFRDSCRLNILLERPLFIYCKLFPVF